MSGSRPGRLASVAPAMLVALVAMTCWIWFRWHTGIRLEDALITCRYAQNLAEGHGFVFNPGERVLGTTTPLLTMALGLLGALFGVDRIPIAANVLMMLAGAGAGVLTFLALKEFGCPRGMALFACAALLFNPDWLWMAAGGMETPLVLLLMASSLRALAAKHHGAAAACAALLVLTRIDGVIWAAGVLACIVWRERAAARRPLTIFAALLAPWVVFALIYFGSPIPNSVIAKRVIGQPGGDAGGIAGLPHLLEHLAWNGPFFAWSVPFARPLGWLAFVAGVFAIFRRPSHPALRMLAVFPVIFSAALYAGRAPLWFDWYLAPVGYTALLVGVLGISWLASFPVSSASRTWARLLAASALIVYFALLGFQGRQTAAVQRDYQINEDGTRRVLGEWLRDNTPADAVVAMEAVGYQAYYSNRRVIDLAGLVSPAVVDIRRTSRSNAEALDRVLRELEPGYLVLRCFEVDRNAHYHGGLLFESTGQMAYFGGNFEEVRRFEAPLPRVWGDTSCLTVYRRMTR